MRHHAPLYCMPMFVALATSGHAMADTTVDAATGSPPVVVAVDATLDADDRALVDASIISIAAALPHDTELGLIVFGDVVLQVVPLGPLRAEQLDDIESALNAPSDTTDNNLSIGLERGIDELREQQSGHLLVFAHARVAGATTEDSARFLEWYRELLLPDAAERDIAITLVSPETDADAAVRADLIAYPGNASFPLDGKVGTGTDMSLTQTLLQRMLDGTSDDADTRRPATAPTDSVPTSDTAASVPPVTPSAVTPITTGTTTAITGGADTSGVATVTDTGPFASRPRWLYAVVALSLALSGLLLVLIARSLRRRTTMRTAAARVDTSTTSTSSTYLPLHATPTRSFTPVPAPTLDTTGPTQGQPMRGAVEEDETGRTRVRERDATEMTRMAPATRERTATSAGANVTDTAAASDGADVATTQGSEKVSATSHADDTDELELLASLTAERNKIDPLD